MHNVFSSRLYYCGYVYNLYEFRARLLLETLAAPPFEAHDFVGFLKTSTTYNAVSLNNPEIIIYRKHSMDRLGVLTKAIGRQYVG